ncbi:MAG: hypothetical protein WBD31_28775 [Rubripirellula sp.]
MHPNIAVAEPTQTADVMPTVGDFTSMWWADGFPGIIPEASWRRCIRSGTYAFVLDTETLGIPHLGPIVSEATYANVALQDNVVWQSLEPAELSLSVTVDGTVFRCTRGTPWSRYSGPRVVDAGRLVQRADITELRFESDNGDWLNAEARFETVAWPDQLAMILAVRPGVRSSRLRKEQAVQPPNRSRQPSRAIARERWRNASMEIGLRSHQGELLQTKTISATDDGEGDEWQEVSLAFDPVTFSTASTSSPVRVRATEIPNKQIREVVYDSARGWHQIDIDGIVPTTATGNQFTKNDSIERIRLLLSNPSDTEQVARLLFSKATGNIRQGMGSAITGISAVLRDSNGMPTGIPVQLSKNWHTDPLGGHYLGPWFHGFSMLRLPAGASIELELTLCYGHWGGVPAASQAQLSLIGWGSNQHWTQSAIGAWGESICFEPEQVQANCTITDVRPVLVSTGKNAPQWVWTGNVGGGDFFRCFDSDGKRVAHSAMQTIDHRQGPCLTEVTFAGKVGPGIVHQSTVSLARTDDIVRGTYRVRMDVSKATDFTRFVIFQIGADTYSFTRENKFAVGNETGLLKEWNSQWGGDAYRTKPCQAVGRTPWVSLHEAIRPDEQQQYAWANRGLVIREWSARLGGRAAPAAWLAERGVARGDSSTLDVLPPPGVTRFEPGDFVEATFEHIVMPQNVADYYGPNDALREALAKDANTALMIQREAIGNNREVEMVSGTIQHRYPDIRVAVEGNGAAFKLTGGLAYVPVTFTGLASHDGYVLNVDHQALDQSTHGDDFWQTDYDPSTRTWSRTYNIPAGDGNVLRVDFGRADR